MASLLYVFPHPDDECFGPVPALAQQRRTGHEVHLLTLTRGEATSQRERLGYSKADMAAARYEEMQGVAATLDLSSLTVLEYPDGGLAELNPLVLEDEVTAHIHAHETDSYLVCRLLLEKKKKKKNKKKKKQTANQRSPPPRLT